MEKLLETYLSDVGDSAGDSARRSFWRGAREIVFESTLYLEKQSENVSDYSRYVIMLNRVSAITVTPDLCKSVLRALNLKIDLCKNSFGNTPFITRSHGKVEVTGEIRFPVFESHACRSHLNCQPRSRQLSVRCWRITDEE